jgi:hypothetical protein
MDELRYTIVYNSKLIRRAEKFFDKRSGHSFPSHIIAMVWDGNTVHVRGDYISQLLLNHELIHLAQMKQVGFKQYLLNYFEKERHLPYNQKSTEIEAFTNQFDLDYIEKKYGMKPVKENEIYE